MTTRERIGLVALMILFSVGSNFLVWKLAGSIFSSDSRKTEVSNSMRDTGVLPEKTGGRVLHQSETIQSQIHQLEKREGRMTTDFSANLSTGPVSPSPESKPVEIVIPTDSLEPTPRCLFRTIDKGEITAEITGLSKHGVRGLAANLTAWRIEPDWRMKLFEGPIDIDLSEYQFSDPIPKTRWMAGPIIGLGSDGPMYGGILISPEVKIWRIGGRSVSGLMGGGNGVIAWTGVAFGW